MIDISLPPSKQLVAHTGMKRGGEVYQDTDDNYYLPDETKIADGVPKANRAVQAGRGYSFNASQGAEYTDTVTDLTGGSQEIDIEFRIKFSSVSGFRFLAAVGENGNGFDFEVLMYGASDIRLSVRGVTTITYDHPALSTDTWYKIRTTYTNGAAIDTARLWIEDVEYPNISTSANTVALREANLFVDNRRSITTGSSGTWDYVILKIDGVVHTHGIMEEGAGEKCFDISDNGHHGAINLNGGAESSLHITDSGILESRANEVGHSAEGFIGNAGGDITRIVSNVLFSDDYGYGEANEFERTATGTEDRFYRASKASWNGERIKFWIKSDDPTTHGRTFNTGGSHSIVQNVVISAEWQLFETIVLSNLLLRMNVDYTAGQRFQIRQLSETANNTTRIPFHEAGAIPASLANPSVDALYGIPLGTKFYENAGQVAYPAQVKNGNTAFSNGTLYATMNNVSVGACRVEIGIIGDPTENFVVKTLIGGNSPSNPILRLSGNNVQAGNGRGNTYLVGGTVKASMTSGENHIVMENITTAVGRVKVSVNGITASDNNLAGNIGAPFIFGSLFAYNDGSSGDAWGRCTYFRVIANGGIEGNTNGTIMDHRFSEGTGRLAFNTVLNPIANSNWKFELNGSTEGTQWNSSSLQKPNNILYGYSTAFNCPDQTNRYFYFPTDPAYEVQDFEFSAKFTIQNSIATVGRIYYHLWSNDSANRNGFVIYWDGTQFRYIEAINATTTESHFLWTVALVVGRTYTVNVTKVGTLLSWDISDDQGNSSVSSTTVTAAIFYGGAAIPSIVVGSQWQETTGAYSDSSVFPWLLHSLTLNDLIDAEFTVGVNRIVNVASSAVNDGVIRNGDSLTSGYTRIPALADTPQSVVGTPLTNPRLPVLQGEGKVDRNPSDAPELNALGVKQQDLTVENFRVFARAYISDVSGFTKANSFVTYSDLPEPIVQGGLDTSGGTGHRIDMPARAGAGTNYIEVELIFKCPTITTQVGLLVDWLTTGDNRLMFSGLQTTDGGIFRFIVYGDGTPASNFQNYTYPVTAGVTYHFKWIWDGLNSDKVTLEVNGKIVSPTVVGNDPIGTTTTPGTSKVTVAALGASSQDFIGEIYYARYKTNLIEYEFPLIGTAGYLTHEVISNTWVEIIPKSTGVSGQLKSGVVTDHALRYGARKALAFDDTNNYLDFGPNTDLHIQAFEVDFEFASSDETSTWILWVAADTNFDSGWGIRRTPDSLGGEMQIVSRNPAQSPESGGLVPRNQLNRMTLKIYGGNYYWFTEGVQTSTGAWAGSIVYDANDPFLIGVADNLTSCRVTIIPKLEIYSLDGSGNRVDHLFSLDVDSLTNRGARNSAPDRSAGREQGAFINGSIVVNPYLIPGKKDGSLTDIDGEPISNQSEVDKYKYVANYLKI